MRADLDMAVTQRLFPPPWSVDDPDMKLGQDCFIVRDANGHALAYVYFKDEPGLRLDAITSEVGARADSSQRWRNRR